MSPELLRKALRRLKKDRQEKVKTLETEHTYLKESGYSHYEVTYNLRRAKEEVEALKLLELSLLTNPLPRWRFTEADFNLKGK